MEKPRTRFPISSVKKKVRFDMEHKIFVIPSKWENVNRETRKHVPKGKHLKEQARESKTQGQKLSKSKQFKSGKQIKLYKKTNEKLKRAANMTVNLNGKGEDKHIPKLKLPYDSTTSGHLVKDKPVETRENGLKTGHLRTKASVKLEMTKRGINNYGPKVVNVLPKITYRPDLRRAIEKAFTRSKCFSQEDLHLAGLSIYGDSINKELEKYVSRERQTLKTPNSNDRSLVTKRTQKYLLNTDSEQYERHVDQLSKNIDKWAPFQWPVWNEIAKPDLSSQKEKRFSLIPDSILY